MNCIHDLLSNTFAWNSVQEFVTCASTKNDVGGVVGGVIGISLGLCDWMDIRNEIRGNFGIVMSIIYPISLGIMCGTYPIIGVPTVCAIAYLAKTRLNEYEYCVSYDNITDSPNCSHEDLNNN